jgi:integrase
VTLQAAHDQARAHQAQIRSGSDPLRAKIIAKSELAAAQARARKFKPYAESYIDAHEAEWKSNKHAAQWRSTTETYVYPVIGGIVLADVDTPLVLQILRPIWQSKTETAKRVRGRVESVLDAARSEGLRTGANPAAWKGHLDAVLPAPRKIAKVKHQPSLPYARCPAFMSVLREGKGQGARALEFTILTAVRSDVTRSATWCEFDREGKVWTIPAVRMKAPRDHRVPLTDEMLAALAAQPQGKGEDYVFQAPRGGALSDRSLLKVVRDLNEKQKSKDAKWVDPENGRQAVPHGFRASFRNWAGEQTSHPYEVAEAALSHKLGDATETAYYRSDLFDRRRILMQEWTAFLCGSSSVGSR